MTREDFMHRANMQVDDIKSAFEQMMALYCLYNGIGDDNKFKIVYGDSETSLNILLDTSEQAKEVLQIVNGLSLRLYDQLYLVCGEVRDNIVCLKLLL